MTCFKSYSVALLASSAVMVASSAHAQSLFLDDASVWSGDGAVETMDVVVTNGEITSMAAELSAPEDTDVIASAWITPPLFAPISTLGLVDVGAESSTNDTSANTELSSASLRASDSFNPRIVHIPNARRRGVGYAAVAPNPTGDTIFGGIGLIADLSDTSNGILDDSAFMHIALGQSGANRAGGSRSAALAQLRGAFSDARRPFADQTEADILRRLDAQALRPVLSGQIPLLITANRAADLSLIMELKSDYPSLDIIVIGAKEAHLVATDLADSEIKVVIDPHDNLPDNFDGLNASFDNARLLYEAGVDFAIGNTSSLGVSKAGNLPQHAGNAVASGLPHEVALSAITTVPASWFGVDMGDMDDGNFVVWDGDPLNITSAPIAMAKDGESVSLESRMTALRDRYNPLVRDERPHKYR